MGSKPPQHNSTQDSGSSPIGSTTNRELKSPPVYGRGAPLRSPWPPIGNGSFPIEAVVDALVGAKVPPPPSQPKMGFFTDTSLCIGCKACEVACKQWNQLP